MNQSTSLVNSSSSPLSSGQRIAYIQAGWHRDIVAQSFVAFNQHLLAHGIASEQIELFDVPGSLEIPLQCKLLAQTGDFAIIVAAGLIVDGGIYRHDFVASSVLNSIMQVQLASEVPILSVVLTPHHFSDSQEHHDFFFDHFKLKGKEAAQACLQTLGNLSKLTVAA